MEQVVIEILKTVGVYERAKQIIGSDAELVRLFDEDFEQLIHRVEG